LGFITGYNKLPHINCKDKDETVRSGASGHPACQSACFNGYCMCIFVMLDGDESFSGLNGQKLSNRTFNQYGKARSIPTG
jgi:hypothetical protein